MGYRQLSPVEEKILEILFQDKIVTDILVDHLLPEITWSQEANTDYTPEMAYQIARENLAISLKRFLNENI